VSEALYKMSEGRCAILMVPMGDHVRYFSSDLFDVAHELLSNLATFARVKVIREVANVQHHIRISHLVD